MRPHGASLSLLALLALLASPSPQILLANHLSAMGSEGSCHRESCEVEIVSIEWSTKEEPHADSPQTARSVALRYYSHERDSSSSSADTEYEAGTQYEAGLRAIERLHWPAPLKKKLHDALSAAQPFKVGISANGAVDLLRPTLHHLMWRSPRYDPRAVSSTQGLPPMTPTTAMVYFPEADEAQSFERTRALLGSLFHQEFPGGDDTNDSRAGDTTMLSRFDAWSAEALSAMRAQDDMARAILQVRRAGACQEIRVTRVPSSPITKP